MNTITTEPATKRARNASVVLTDRHCQKRVAKRIKIYDRKCPGLPHDTKLWEWRCGFYPGSNPGEHQSGTAASFAEARANFESVPRGSAAAVSPRNSRARDEVRHRSPFADPAAAARQSG
jgi:hypothetical protein